MTLEGPRPDLTRTAPRPRPTSNQTAPDRARPRPGSGEKGQETAPETPLPVGSGVGARSVPDPSRYQHPGVLTSPPADSTCRRCLAPVWTAVVDGGKVTLDPCHLPPLEELQLRANGERGIYQARPSGNTWILSWRWVSSIANTPANAIVLAAHRCTRRCAAPVPAKTRHDLNLPDTPEF